MITICSATGSDALRDRAAAYIQAALAWGLAPEAIEDGLAGLGIESQVDAAEDGHIEIVVAAA